jgi:MFS family permease
MNESRQGMKTFLLLWSSQLVSVFGGTLSYFAVSVWLAQVLYPLETQKPQLGVALALVGLAYALPGFLAAPFAGLVVDRSARKRVMMLADGTNALVSLVIAGLTLTGQLNLVVLLSGLAVNAAAAIFHATALDASTVMIVPPHNLPRANAMMQSTWSLSSVLGPAIAAGVIAFFAPTGVAASAAGQTGVAVVFMVDGLSSLFAVAVLAFLHVPSPVRNFSTSTERPSWLEEATAGWGFILSRRALLSLLLTFAVVNFAASPLTVFEPLLVKFQLSGNWNALGLNYASALAVLTTAGAVGGVVGGVVMTAWGGLRSRRIYGVLIPIIVGGIAQIALGLTPALFMASASMFFIAAMPPFANAHNYALWQSEVVPNLQGRVYAVRRMIAQFINPLSLALAGIAPAFIDPGLTLAALGMLIVVVCVPLLFHPALRRLGETQADGAQ